MIDEDRKQNRKREPYRNSGIVEIRGCEIVRKVPKVKHLPPREKPVPNEITELLRKIQPSSDAVRLTLCGYKLEKRDSV